MSSLRKSTVDVIDDDPDVLGSLRFLLIWLNSIVEVCYLKYQ